MKIQHDIPTELNKKLKVYRIEKGFKNLSEAIHFILNKFFKENEK
jgi:hypothetical protein